MIEPTFVIPIAVAAMAAAGLAAHHQRLVPSLAARALTVVAGSVALGAAGVVGLLALLYVAALPPLAEQLSWCHAVAEHAPPTALGVPALVLLGAMVVSLVRAARRLRLPVPDGRPLLVLPDAAPTAFAVPGRPGQVVVSQGLLRALDPDERRVLLAHERSHLRRGHHRYVRIVGLAAAVIPPLAPLADRVRFATERWADEDAAQEVGDRRLVARAIAQAALLGTSAPTPALAAASTGVPARVRALVERPSLSSRWRVAQAGGVLSGLFGLAAVVVQYHHFATALDHLCPV